MLPVILKYENCSLKSQNRAKSKLVKKFLFEFRDQLRFHSFLRQNVLPVISKYDNCSLKSHFKMTGKAHFTHFVPEKGRNQNSKNKGGLINVLNYSIKHKIKVPFDKRSVPLNVNNE